jgi:hypothetical protein
VPSQRSACLPATVGAIPEDLCVSHEDFPCDEDIAPPREFLERRRRRSKSARDGGIKSLTTSCSLLALSPSQFNFASCVAASQRSSYERTLVTGFGDCG